MKSLLGKKVFILILSLFFITNCSFFKKLKEKSENSENQDSSSLDLSKDWGKKEIGILKSNDGLSQITLFEGWREQKGLNEKAEIEASNPITNNFIIVLSESKLDFNHMTLDKHSEATRSILLEAIKDPKVEGPFPLKINGYPAVQYKITGAVDDLNPVYLHTTVETPKNFHQVLAWTLVSKFEKNKVELQKVIASFKEIKQ